MPKANGVKLGRRPIGSDIEDKIRKLRSDGMGMLRIGRELGVGTSVVQRVVAE
jgi:DNA invertase Pin-like site-specific DNA recombinase